MFSENKEFWKHTLMVAALVLLVCIAGVINFGGDAAVKLVSQMLATQNSVQGKLTYEKINAGWSGDVEVRGLKWIAPNGDKLAEVPLTTISVNFFDTLIKGGGVANVSSVVLNRPHFYGDFDNVKGFDLLKSINFIGEPQLPGYKSEKPLTPTEFRGILEVKDGILELKINGKPMNFTKISLQGIFKQYPVLKAAITAKSADADFVLNLTKEGKATKVNGEVKKAMATDLMYMFPNLKDIKVVEGQVPTAKFNAETKGDKWDVYVDGDLKDLKGKAFAWNISGGQAKFLASRDEIKLQSMRLELNNMPVDIEGSIKTAVGTPQPASYNITFKAPQFDLTALSKGLEIDGKLQAKGRLTGTILEPKLEGSFTADSLRLAPLNISQVAGQFKWAHGNLNLGDATGKAYDGQVRLNGAIALEKGDFDFHFEGIDINAAAFTNNEVEGKLKFDTRLTGTNAANTAKAVGDFSIEDGKFRGDGMGYLRGRINQVNGAFGTSDVRMHKGFKYFDVKVVLTEDKKVKVIMPADEKKAEKAIKAKKNK